MASVSQGALLITLTRCGGGFLLSCLAKHPYIETHDLNNWRNALEIGAEGHERLLAALLHRPRYRLSIVKMLVKGCERTPVDFCLEHEVKVIHLERKNVLRHATSAMMKAGYGGERWDTDVFFEICDVYAENQRKQREYVQSLEDAGIPILRLAYRDLVGGEGREASEVGVGWSERICDFLGVENHRLWTDLTKNHPWAMQDVATNWDELKDAIIDSTYAPWIDEERFYALR